MLKGDDDKNIPEAVKYEKEYKDIKYLKLALCIKKPFCGYSRDCSLKLKGKQTLCFRSMLGQVVWSVNINRS